MKSYCRENHRWIQQTSTHTNTWHVWSTSVLKAANDLRWTCGVFNGLEQVLYWRPTRRNQPLNSCSGGSIEQCALSLAYPVTKNTFTLWRYINVKYLLADKLQWRWPWLAQMMAVPFMKTTAKFNQEENMASHCAAGNTQNCVFLTVSSSVPLK